MELPLSASPLYLSGGTPRTGLVYSSPEAARLHHEQLLTQQARAIRSGACTPLSRSGSVNVVKLALNDSVRVRAPGIQR